jgi:Arc/MetJ family transcription regulator
MKTTINIDDTLLEDAIKASGSKTKTEAVERGLKELVAVHKRRDLSVLFGKEKNISMPRRRR